MSSKLRLDVRMEAFNLFSAPEQNFNSANFGQIASQAILRDWPLPYPFSLVGDTCFSHLAGGPAVPGAPASRSCRSV